MIKTLEAFRKVVIDTAGLDDQDRVLQSAVAALSSFEIFQKAYYNNPDAFFRNCFEFSDEEEPTEYQENIGRLLVANHRVCVRSPHGAGKTTVAAWIVLWFALTRDGRTDWKVPMTASVWRQLTHYLLPEIKKWARRLRWNKIGRAPFDAVRELQILSLKLSTGEAFAVASKDPAYIEGAHASSLLYVYDEAKAVPDDTFDASEGAFSTAGADTADESFALIISTPGEPHGRFYDIQQKKAGYGDWTAVQVTKQMAIDAGRMSEEWADQRAKQWGVRSAVYQNRVEGNFAVSQADGLIPLSWIERSNEYWYEWKEAGFDGRFVRVGVDVARYGGDKTVLALHFDRRPSKGSLSYFGITELRVYQKQSTMETAGYVRGVLERYGEHSSVDVIGMGAGVVDRLKEQGFMTGEFNAGVRGKWRDKSGEFGFKNLRSYSFWLLRELLDPDNLHKFALPPDDLLTGDLTALRYRVTSGAVIEIEDKEAMRKRIKRSTDYADAVAIAMYKIALKTGRGVWI